MIDDSDEPDTGDSKSSGKSVGGPPRMPMIPGDEELVVDKHVKVDKQDELVFTIVSSVADVRGVDVNDTLPTLQESIDVDALMQVFQFQPGAPYRSGWVTFFFAGCRIVLNSNQRLQIYDRGDPESLEPDA